MKYKYIYIAGPYTKGDVVMNVRAAVEAAEEVIKIGYMPYVPHLSHLWHCMSPHDIDYWYRLDNEWLKRCDALVRLPGESSGADAEVRLADSLGIPVFDSVNDLMRYE